MEDYEEIYRFCEDNVYPCGLSKNQKRNFRRKCGENFKTDDGQLYYRRSNRGKSDTPSKWMLAVKTVEEKERVLKSCHSSPTGTDLLMCFGVSC